MCKDMLAKKIGDMNQVSDRRYQNLNEVTHSNMLSSSYGNDYYFDMEGSDDIDDLDNEVSNIAKKFKEKQANDKQRCDDDSQDNEINHSDIQINIGNINSKSNAAVKIEDNEVTPKAHANKLDEYKDFNSDEKKLFEERKLFEG